MAKVQNQKIQGDDQQWKRAVEDDIIRLEGLLRDALNKIEYLQKRVK